MRTAIRRFAAALLFLSAGLAAAGEDQAGPEEKIDIPVRIAEAAVGEWALYRTANGGRSRLTIVEKREEPDGMWLVIRNEITRPSGKKGGVREEEVKASEAEEDIRTLGPEDTVTRAEVLVHGRTLKTVVVTYVENGVPARQSYYSDQIPVYGLVRGVTLGNRKETALSLVDYGFADQE